MAVHVDDIDKTAVGTKRRHPIYRYIPIYETRHTARHLYSLLLILLILAGVTALILFLVYRPSHPRFSLATASVLSLNSSLDSDPTVVSATLQFTLLIRNPSARSSIRYDRLSAYAAYRNQQITPPVELPPLAQDRESTVVVSPVMGGEYVAVARDVAEGLDRDNGFGVVGLRVVVIGRVKYRSGPFRSAWHGLYVRCDAVLGVGKGVVPGQSVLVGEPRCDVDA